MELEKTCLLCGKTGFSFINNVRDVDDKKVYKCNACGHVQLFPLPTREEDEDFYQTDKMYKSIFQDNIALQNEENLMQRYKSFVKEQADTFAKHVKAGKRILDIGTGYGWLVSYSRKHLSYFTGQMLTDCMRRAGYKDISTFGHQVYTFENALWWIKEKRPFFDYHQVEVPEQLNWLNDIYKEKIESEMKSNCLIGIGYKND